MIAKEDDLAGRVERLERDVARLEDEKGDLDDRVADLTKLAEGLAGRLKSVEQRGGGPQQAGG
jgi:hypothetical protein